MKLIKKVTKRELENSNLAENLMDEYTDQVFEWWGNWPEDFQEEQLKEYCDFYEKMGWNLPPCLNELMEN